MSEGDSPLLLAAKEGRLEDVKALLEQGIFVDARQVEGEQWTPLMMAAEHGRTQVVRVLLEHGADPLLNKHGTRGTALHCAAWWGHCAAAELLLAAGALVDELSWDSRTPLHYATGRQEIQVSRLLVDHGASIDVRDRQGHLPLNYLEDHSAKLLLWQAAQDVSSVTRGSTHTCPELTRNIPPKLKVAGDEGEHASPAVSMRWERGKLLGSGRSGSTFLCLDTDTAKMLAVKQIPVMQGIQRTSLQDPLPPTIEVAAQQLEREVAELCQLHHPNLVQIWGMQRAESGLNVFQEYVAGGSLAALLDMFGALQENTIRIYTQQILAGLMYLCDHSIAHGNLKGSNILVREDGVIKLSNYGGVPAHIRQQQPAPEGSTLAGAEQAADIWSLGCILLELMSGRSLMTDLDPAAALAHVASVEQAPNQCTPSLAAIHFLKCCFAMSPDKRPTVRELLIHPWLAFNNGSCTASKAVVKQPVTPARLSGMATDDGLAVKQAERTITGEPECFADVPHLEQEVGSVQLELVAMSASEADGTSTLTQPGGGHDATTSDPEQHSQAPSRQQSSSSREMTAGDGLRVDDWILIEEPGGVDSSEHLSSEQAGFDKEMMHNAVLRFWLRLQRLVTFEQSM